MRCKAIKASIKAPFPLVEISEFAPPWAIEIGSSSTEDNDGEEKSTKKLDAARWASAFINMAIAADAAKVRLPACLCSWVHATCCPIPGVELCRSACTLPRVPTNSGCAL